MYIIQNIPFQLYKRYRTADKTDMLRIAQNQIITKVVTGFKMAVSSSLDIVYDQVRRFGLPNQIKESGGSVLIRIWNKQFNHNRDKFRFHTRICFNGSENTNWIAPNIFEENST